MAYQDWQARMTCAPNYACTSQDVANQNFMLLVQLDLLVATVLRLAGFSSNLYQA